jgi:N-acetylmuramoyl-L-alanine amidase
VKGDNNVDSQRLYIQYRGTIIKLLFGLLFFSTVFMKQEAVYAKDKCIICPVKEEIISEEEEVIVTMASTNGSVSQMIEEVNQNVFYETILNEEFEETEVSSNEGFKRYSDAVINNVLYDVPMEKQIKTQEVSIVDKTQAMSVMSINEYNLQIKYGITGEELDLLERIVQAEAGGEDLKGKILVANVILNRVHSSRFPNDIKSVIMAGRQFSPVSDGRLWTVTVSAETKEAVQRALDGEDYSQGALYFMARSAADPGNVTWFDRALTRLFRHGGHEFFK